MTHSENKANAERSQWLGQGELNWLTRKNDGGVDFKLDFEEVGDESRASEESRENHEERNREIPADVAFANLNVLNLRRFAGESCGVRKDLNLDADLIAKDDDSFSFCAHFS